MRPRKTSSIGRPARLWRLRARNASRGPLTVALDRKLRRLAPATRDAPIRCAAVRLPPAAVETYCDTARPRLARSAPPDVAKRERLFRAIVKRSAAAASGIGGRAGGVGTGAGAPSGAGALAGGGGTGGASAGPSEPSHVGTSGVPPPGPPRSE